jgi:prophage antirepressor-like protein
MSALQVFDFEEKAVRTLLRDGEPWFVARDVCAVLEIESHRNVVARLDDDEKGVHTMDSLGGAQPTSIVSESGLYALIFTSRKPEAKRFRKWVTGEVLPTLRKTGQYDLRGDVDEADLPMNADLKVFGMSVAKVNAFARLVGVANSIFGPEAARRLWAKEKSLPNLAAYSVEALTGSAADDGRGLLKHILRLSAGESGSIGALVTLARHDKIAAGRLKEFGLTLMTPGKPQWLTVANKHPFLAERLENTQWRGNWRAALDELPGTKRGANSVMVPMKLIDEFRLSLN